MTRIARNALLSMATILVLAFAPLVANAAFIRISDITNTLSGTSDFSGSPPFIITSGPETVTFTGVFTSTDPSRPAVGASSHFNVNFRPGLPSPCTNELTPIPCLSDTLAVTLTGVTGGNVRVDVTFISDPTVGPLSPALPDIIEDGSFQGIRPLIDLEVSARSDCLEGLTFCVQAPGPASLWLLGVALAGLGLMRRRGAERR
jgi:hypothetical protein